MKDREKLNSAIDALRADENDPPWLRRYHRADIYLTYYRGTKGAGIALFAAYEEHRAAWNLWRDDEAAQRHEAEIRAKLAADGRPIQNTFGSWLELQREGILFALDQINADILEWLTAASAGHSDNKRLSGIRAALRSGKGREWDTLAARMTEWISVSAIRQEVAGSLSINDACRRVSDRLGIEFEAVKRAWIKWRKADAEIREKIAQKVAKAGYRSGV